MNAGYIIFGIIISFLVFSFSCMLFDAIFGKENFKSKKPPNL